MHAYRRYLLTYLHVYIHSSYLRNTYIHTIYFNLDLAILLPAVDTTTSFRSKYSSRISQIFVIASGSIPCYIRLTLIVQHIGFMYKYFSKIHIHTFIHTYILYI